MKLLRQAGKPIVVEFSLAKVIAPPRADPNNYYATLGLNPRKVWSDTEIRTAFRDRAKQVHPDGTDPDPVAYDRLQVAYQVLSDPELRRKYDALDATQLWKDKDVVAIIIRKVAEARAKGRGSGEVKDFVPALREVLQVTKATSARPEFDEWSFYYYEGEDIPSADVRNQWVDHVQHVAWGLGKGPEIKLGFTTGEPHVVERPWGQVLMVAGDPSTEAAYELVALLN